MQEGSKKSGPRGISHCLVAKMLSYHSCICGGLQKEFFQPQLLDKPTVTSEGRSKWVKKREGRSSQMGPSHSSAASLNHQDTSSYIAAPCLCSSLHSSPNDGKVSQGLFLTTFLEEE